VDVTVVGAGVIGLMAAHALAHRGHEVRIVARDLGDETTSARAAASFKPSTVPHTGPYRRLLLDSRRELDRWTREGFAAALGITEARHIEASDRPLEPRDYLEVMRDVRHLSARAGDAIPGGYAYAVSYRTYFFDVPVTLPALSEHVTGVHGIPVRRATVERLEDLTTGSRRQVLVNAAGLGARRLAADTDVIPVRGQTVLVPSHAEVDASIYADGYYAYPRSDGIVLGGTAEHGVWEAKPQPRTIARIIASNARVLPHVRDAEPLQSRAGLRPYRHGGVRLELDRTGPTPVVHAYGHGGSGWTLGPGTAAWVAAAVDAVGAPDSG
jgi:D-amino-acid oxidase